jgi:hypothetical protein
VSEYRLDDRGSIPDRPNGFFSSNLRVQTSSEAHPASYPMGTRVLSPEGKAWPGRDADHSPPSNAKVNNEYELYFLSSLAPALRSRTVLLYFTFTETPVSFYQTICRNIPGDSHLQLLPMSFSVYGRRIQEQTDASSVRNISPPFDCLPETGRTRNLLSAPPPCSFSLLIDSTFRLPKGILQLNVCS